MGLLALRGAVRFRQWLRERDVQCILRGVIRQVLGLRVVRVGLRVRGLLRVQHGLVFRPGLDLGLGRVGRRVPRQLPLDRVRGCGRRLVRDSGVADSVTRR